MEASFDLRTLAGIDAAERDTAAFEARCKDDPIAGLFQWGLVIGRRRLDIANARAALANERGAQ